MASGRGVARVMTCVSQHHLSVNIAVVCKHQRMAACSVTALLDSTSCMPLVPRMLDCRSSWTAAAMLFLFLFYMLYTASTSWETLRAQRVGVPEETTTDRLAEPC
jgi:hypothetical protein